MGEWKPIETAPRDGTAIWIFVDGGPYIGYCEPADEINETDVWFVKASFRRRDRARGVPDDIFSTYGHHVNPTLWMPLPEPPRP